MPARRRRYEGVLEEVQGVQGVVVFFVLEEGVVGSLFYYFALLDYEQVVRSFYC